jgi:hypothetical protein
MIKREIFPAINKERETELTKGHDKPIELRFKVSFPWLKLIYI